MLTNKRTNTKPSIIHSPGMANSDYFKTNSCWSIIEKLSKKAKSNSPKKTSVILCNNIDDSVAEQCLKRIGIDHLVLGKQVEKWNNLYKLKLIVDYLEKSKPEQILYVDSTDVLVIGDITECDNILQKNKCKMIFNAELKFYPQCPSLKCNEEFEIRTSPNEYFALNAGCWIAESDFLLSVLEEILNMDMTSHVIENKGKIEEFRITKSDQFRWHILYKKYYPKIKLDHKCDIFQNIYLHNHFDFFQKML
jgi:hypothetical protein